VLGVLPSLEPTRAAELVLKVFSVESLRSEELLDNLSRAMTVGIPRFRSNDLTRLTATFAAWALWTGSGGDDNRSRLSEPLRNYFNSVSAEVLLRLMDVAPADLARVTEALASVGVGGVRLFGSVARAAVARADRFACADLVALVSAFSSANCFQTGLFEALARSMRQYLHELTPKDVLRGMQALAVVGIRDEMLGQAVGEQLPKKGIDSGVLTAEESCRLAWCMCVLDLHHDKLFRAVFRALEDAPVQGSATLCQLYEIHLTLRAEHRDTYKAYELEDDTVQSLRTHYIKQGGGGRNTKLERSTERLHDDVGDLLHDLVEGSVSTNHVSALGFPVDVAATVKRSKRSKRDKEPEEPIVFIDVDGVHTLIRSLDPAENAGLGQGSRIRGLYSLKRRVLAASGMRMVVFSEDDWRALDGSRDRREFLRSLIRRAGVPENIIRIK